MRDASHAPWSYGTIRSWRPCQMWTGTAIDEVESPRLDERHVVVEPAPVRLAKPSRKTSRHPVGELAGQGAAVDVVDEVAERVGHLVAVTARKVGQFRSLNTMSASGPSSAALNSSTFSSPIPAR